MADGDVDISGMPPPPAAQDDPTANIPAPEDLYKQYRGLYPEAQVDPDDVAEFMKNPPADLHMSAGERFKKGVSGLTGIPRATAGYAAAVPAGVASVAGQLSGALAAGLDPSNATEHLEQGNQRGREWAAKVNKLADYVPATAEGAKTAAELLALPGNLIKEVGDTTLKPLMSDNAYQTLGEVGQDVATDLPALGAPTAVRGAAKTVSKAAKAAREAVKAEAATATAPDETSSSAPLKPDVGKPVSAEDLQAAPNPIPPPEGTVAAARAKQKAAPAAAPLPADAPMQDVAEAAAAKPPTQVPAPEPTAEAPAPEAAGTPSPGDTQRGSVRLFNTPADEGPQETPTPEKQNERAAHLDALDKLSGGQMPTRRASALTGDYNATGDDWQAKEVGSPTMRAQVASENNALHQATENVHDSLGSQFENSVDSTTLGDRGRVTRGAIQAIEKHFNDATDSIYDTAREANKGKPIPKLQRVSDYLNDDSNFTNDAEIGLQRAAKQRMERLWTTGDPDKGAPPGSVNAAERLREFLNEKGKNPSAMGVAKDLKGHLDMDVAEHGGPGLFQAARAMRTHQFQMLEEPTGIKKLLAPGDSQGINHAIPEHKVMDYIADLPREQHEHVLNVLRAGAHLDPELAKTSAAALREIQAHTVSRIHAAATNADGTWNARKFYTAADKYQRNMGQTFKDRPDVLRNLKTINDAGNTLHMDKHYPGAEAQKERTSTASRLVKGVGGLAGHVASEIPFGGRTIGRAIEAGTEKVSGEMSAAAKEREVASRLVDRNGKQRGSVQVMRAKEPGAADSMLDEFHSKFKEPAPTGFSGKRVGNANVDIAKDPFDPNRAHVEMLRADKPNMGAGSQALRAVNSLADKHGTTLQLDAAPVGKGGPDVAKLKDFYSKHGFEPDAEAPGATANTMTRIPAGQRGSFSFQNDNALNRATAGARDSQRGGVERNPRSEYNANSAMTGNRKLTAEQQSVLDRLSGTPSPGNKQRGSVKVTDNPNFKKWFGESKITDESGEPKVVYHGTNKAFNSFDVKNASSKTGNPNAQLGHFFSESPTEASRYAADWGKSDGHVIPAYLAISNPYHMPYKEFNDLSMGAWKHIKGGETKEQLTKLHDDARAAAVARRTELEKLGHDGIVTRVGGMNEYIAFKPHQIKSAVGNSGKFSRKDADITAKNDSAPKGGMLA